MHVIIDLLLLLHILLTVYRVASYFKKTRNLEFIFSEYRVASYIRYTATLDLLPLKLLFPRTA